MQDKLSFLKKIKIKIKEPFDKITIKFLNSLSLELKKNKKTFRSPELFYLMLFCSQKNILKFKKRFKGNEFRIGRGLAFHVCPNNVPINFAFSFIFGLLSGNTNIVKLPSKNSPEKELVLNCIKKVLSKKEYTDLRKINFFIQYDHSSSSNITNYISSISDSRIIWGGDETVNELKKIETPPRCVDINFSDRYSLSVIDVKKLNKLSKEKLNILARRFFYDIFTMNQMACNSPHFLFFIGDKNKDLEKDFWNKVSNISREKFKFDEMHVMNKYNNLVNKIMNLNFIDNVKTYQNYLYVVNLKKNISNIEDIRGENGMIFQVNLKNIHSLSEFVKKKCQTITYFGVQKSDFRTLIKKNSLLGADRIVEIGKAFDFDLNWDGFDIIRTLTRVVNIN